MIYSKEVDLKVKNIWQHFKQNKYFIRRTVRSLNFISDRIF